MTDTTPDAAERLAEALEQLDAFAEDFLKADRPFTAAIMRSIAALIRAQAAEIARHPAALQEARNAALREAANIVRGEVYLKHYRTWVIWPPYDDLTQERPNVSENHGKARHCDQLADAILTLIDTPAPPAEPAGGARPDEDWPDIPDTPEDRAYRKGWNEGVTAGKSFTVVSDPSQPDADKREALVTALEEAYQQWLDRKDDGDQWFWHSQADALLAAGWTHKREEG